MFNLLWATYYIGTIFDGLGRLVLHFGIAAILIIGGLAWAYFSPAFKKLGLYLALITGVALAGFTLGVKDENKRWADQEANITKLAEKAHADAVKRVARKPNGLRRDRFDRDGPR
ncbi:MAG TPA: hypothetical protein VFR24_27305 [Candidatus Angelobacter sp.]|nr:hypothetical protein [Candidatus Angelobacter sp.]